MRVTIVIPSYNQSKFLREAIESALEQTVECEVIVVDDGSTDDSLKVAREYEPRIKVISQVNKGLASARNTGIMNAKGTHILPLDADDILVENCVEILTLAAEASDADVVAPSFRCFGEAEENIILMATPQLEDFRTGNRIGYFSLFKKPILLEVGGYSPRMEEGYEDMHLTINLLTRGKRIVTVPQVLVLYRTKKESMWKASLKHHKKLMNQIYHDFPEFLPI